MALIDDSDEMEIVEIDEDTETLAHILTLVMKALNQKIDSGPTYEIVARLIIQSIYEPIAPPDIIEAASAISLSILETAKNKGKPSAKH